MTDHYETRVERKQREADAHRKAWEIVDFLSSYIPESARGQAIVELAQFLESQDRKSDYEPHGT
jgi:hypothetical protein